MNDTEGPQIVTKSDLPMATDEALGTYPELPSQQSGIVTGGFSRRSVFKWILGFSVVVICILTIALAATSHKRESSYSMGSDIPDYSGEELPAPPIDLAVTCSFDFINTASGRQACELECQVAKCCDMPPEDSRSCLMNNEDLCFTYDQSCSALDASTPEHSQPHNVPPAPAALNSFCTNDDAVSIYVCETLCSYASCCFTQESEYSCASDSDCSKYEVCRGKSGSRYLRFGFAIEGQSMYKM